MLRFRFRILLRFRDFVEMTSIIITLLLARLSIAEDVQDRVKEAPCYLKSVFADQRRLSIMDDATYQQIVSRKSAQNCFTDGSKTSDRRPCPGGRRGRTAAPKPITT